MLALHKSQRGDKKSPLESVADWNSSVEASLCCVVTHSDRSRMLASYIRRELFFRILGAGALFSGVALVGHIIAGVSLALALALTAGLLLFAVTAVLRRASSEDRHRMVRRTVVGLLSGLLATASYDLSKFVLSQLDPSPYNPFEAIHIFGLLLVGSSVSNFVINAAGTLFHVVNGISFGLAFCFLVAQPTIVSGIAWGLFLALMQLTFYPGWFNIGFYQEFAQISGASHLVYGIVLGYSCRYGLCVSGASKD
jgi:hypothetical protein